MRAGSTSGSQEVGAIQSGQDVRAERSDAAFSWDKAAVVCHSKPDHSDFTFIFYQDHPVAGGSTLYAALPSPGLPPMS